MALKIRQWPKKAIAVGRNNEDQCDVSSWRDIVSISTGAGYLHSVGFQSNVTVMTAAGGNTEGQCEVRGWFDIIAITAGYAHMIELKADERMGAVGRNEERQYEVSG